MKTTTPATRRGREPGMALLGVLVLALIMAGSAAAFVWFMNREQTLAGMHYRTTAALATAEAGIFRTLAVLESLGPDGTSPGRRWRPTAYSEVLAGGPLEGRYTVSLADHPGEAILVLSRGESGGVTRGLRAQVYLASPALLAAIYTAGLVRFEGSPAVTAIVPYEASLRDWPWLHVGAGKGIWLGSADVVINDPSAPVETGAGPTDIPQGVGGGSPRGSLGPVRFLLAPDAEVRVGLTQQPAGIRRLQIGGAGRGELLRTEQFPQFPEVDRTYYKSLAAANTSNAAWNTAAGEYAGDTELARKRDSVYDSTQFARLQAYWKARGARPVLRGVIYVTGGLAILAGQHIEIVEGALITENTVHLAERAVLEIKHSPGTRTLPGLLVLREGALVVSREARVHVHGLVYAGRIVDIGSGALLDVVGAVAGNTRDLGFRNASAKVSIRYDRAVLGTPGLRVKEGDPVIAWVAAWDELR